MHILNNWKQGRLIFLGTLALSILLLPLFFVITGVFPVYDDYWYANVVSEHGFQEAQFWWRDHATGRFLSTIIISLAYYTVHDLFFHRLLLVIITLFLLGSIYKFFLNFCCKYLKMTKLSVFYIVLLFISFFYNNLVGFSEFIFWLPGASTYALTAALLCMVVNLLFFSKTQEPIKRFFFLCLLGFLVCGTSEIGSFVLFSCFIFYFSLKLTPKSIQFGKLRISTEFFSFIVICSIFYFLVLNAPGNFIRMESEKSANITVGNIRFAIKYGSLNYLNFLYNYFYVRMGWSLFFISAFITSRFGMPVVLGVFFSQSFKRNYILSQLIIFALSGFLFFIYHYSTGITTTIPRALTLIQFLWCMNIIISGMFVGYYISCSRLNFNKRILSYLSSISITITAISSIVSIANGNMVILYGEIFGGTIECDQQYFRDQYDAFERCDVEFVKTQTPKCKSIVFVWDLSDEKFDTRYFTYYENILCKKPIFNP